MSLGSVQVLHKSLQEAKKSLEGTNEAILRMSGRDPNQSRGNFQTDKNYGGGHMRAWSDEFPPPPKRRASGNFRKSQIEEDDIDGGDDSTMKPEEDTTVNLKSSVSAAPVPPRPNINSTTDNTSKQRNRRMFGMLMGTLQKFQKDSTFVTEQEKRRVQIETKLEQVALKEKEEAAHQKKQLLDQRKLQRQIVGRLTNQLESAELYEEWNTCDMHKLNFIKTSAKPSIYYLPSLHNESTQAAIEQSNTVLKNTMAARHNEIQQLLQDNETVVNSEISNESQSSQNPQKTEQNLIEISLEKE